MNNIIISIKRFLRNKNTVTIIGIFAIIGILYWGYNYQINKQVNPIRNIPVAKQTIQPRTLITQDMIDYVDIPPILLQDNLILASSLVVESIQIITLLYLLEVYSIKMYLLIKMIYQILLLSK